MEKVQPTPDDTIVFVGDYVDRGPDSPGVINNLIDFGKEFPNTIFLAGNHDYMLISMLRRSGLLPEMPIAEMKKAIEYETIVKVPPYTNDIPALFYANGGISTVSQYKSFEDVPADHVQFLASLKLFHEETYNGQTFFFVHAGIRAGVALEDQSAKDLLWIRDWYEKSPPGSDYGFGGRIIVRGHQHYVPVPGTEPYLINLDSGVYRNPQEDFGMGVITCCNVVTREIWQA